MKFDGHLIRNGFKLCASSQEKMFNSKFDPEMIGFPKGYHSEVQPLRLNDVRNLIHYLMITGVCQKQFDDWEIESMYMESQGNFGMIFDSIYKTQHQDFM
jgi:hypothetical protein